ncbi:DUF992 domain-containing protein [Nitratireductor sp. GCM10026969]|uniref:DUF992 domain-containing protein n=1 Tax=Nitratireductor sp. GCM10026969 TaxID=3252645 RepID=UPI00360F95FC
MMKYIFAATIFSCAFGFAAANAAETAAQPSEAASKPAEQTKLGVLSCVVDGGIGLLIGSSKGVNCEFTHSDGTVERYTGTMGKLGLDIGITEKSYLKWVVLTPIGNEVGEHALAGDYVGVSAGGSIGLGLGANALIGGSSKKIGLQPFSAEGTKGLNVAIGASKLSLKPAG